MRYAQMVGEIEDPPFEFSQSMPSLPENNFKPKK